MVTRVKIRKGGLPKHIVSHNKKQIECSVVKRDQKKEKGLKKSSPDSKAYQIWLCEQEDRDIERAVKALRSVAAD
jgi:hypothetical protein